MDRETCPDGPDAPRQPGQRCSQIFFSKALLFLVFTALYRELATRHRDAEMLIPEQQTRLLMAYAEGWRGFCFMEGLGSGDGKVARNHRPVPLVLIGRKVGKQVSRRARACRI